MKEKSEVSAAKATIRNFRIVQEVEGGGVQ